MKENILLQITNDCMGSGDDTLGRLLLSNYLKLIYEEDRLPRFIALYNGGSRIVCETPMVESLKLIESKGVKIIVCKTCLNHFGLLDKMEVGITGSMIDIIDLQAMADKVITL